MPEQSAREQSAREIVQSAREIISDEFQGQASLHASDVPSVAVPSVTEQVRVSNIADAAKMQQFLVDFVVEQTGYPAEIVEMDADLEADLGIDSIKKAQLFGELRELFAFPVPTNSENRFSLNEFRTLRSVLELLLGLDARHDAAGDGVATTPESSANVEPVNDPIATLPVSVASQHVVSLPVVSPTLESNPWGAAFNRNASL